MIVTRTWLQEWVDLEGISTEEICKRLNAIGLEVDALTRHRIPEKIVIGHVQSCEKHPDADKLSVCQIDLGTATRQIVCGAKNIAAGQYVPVATVGAVMPNGMKIKHAKLRGVESDGMVCSATELGLPKTDEGIMVLDESIGDLRPGDELCHNPFLNDDVIEIELTANRGDCLSIHGVARELSVAFDRPMKPVERKEKENPKLGIGRVLHFSHVGTPAVDLLYRVVEAESIEVPVLLRLRLGFIDQTDIRGMDAFLAYATHASGVILREYGFSHLSHDEGMALLQLQETDDGLGRLVSGDEELSLVGIYQTDRSKAAPNETRFVLEASYAEPERLARAVKKGMLKTDSLYYRTSRGSEPDLDFGMRVLLLTLQDHLTMDLYAGCTEYTVEKERLTLDISMEEIADLVGQSIEMTTVVSILSKLGFHIHRTEGGRVVFDVPAFRHDIFNRQDIVEEIVRIVGIDNIASKPLRFEEANRSTHDLRRYKFVRDLRIKAVATGFFETVHYIFCDNARLMELGFEPIVPEKALLNPITGEMDGLRPSLMVTMLDSLKRNVAMSKRRIPLFEVGKVFDAERNEFHHLLFAYSGEKESPSLSNAGKPAMIDFPSFVHKLSSILGAFELETTEATNGLMHPYQSAAVMMDGEAVGIVSKLHPSVARMYDLPDTYFAEFDLSKLGAKEVQAKAISQFTPVFRDLSVVVPQSLPYAKIRRTLEGKLPEVVERFYPIDRYVDESLGEDVSLTLRFQLSSMQKTLEEREINAVMEEVLQLLEQSCGAKLR